MKEKYEILNVGIFEYVYNLLNNRWEMVIEKKGNIDDLSIEYVTKYHHPFKNYNIYTYNEYDIYGRLYYKNDSEELLRLKYPVIYGTVPKISYLMFDKIPLSPNFETEYFKLVKDLRKENLLPFELTEYQVKLLIEKLGKDWFYMLGYNDDNYSKPNF